MKIERSSSPARNRRVSSSRQRKQQHLLDVKLRARVASRYRNRRAIVMACQLLLAVAICAGAYLGLRKGISRLFYDNPDYRLATIAVTTDGTLGREQVLKTAQLLEGTNIFRVDLAGVHDRLEQLPQVEEVQVLRKMPNEIDVQIVERKPVAWITGEKQISNPFSSEAAFLVDARGMLMKQKKLLPEYLGLPLIVGCASEPLVAGKTIESYDAKAALELLRLSSGSFMQTRFQVREIDVSKGYCLLVTDKNHTQVMFGFDNLEAQIARLEQFLVFSDDAKREIETVNLIVQRNTPVTFRKPAAAIISEAVENDEVPPPKEAPPAAKAKPASTPIPKAVPVTKPKTSRPSATPMPVRKAVPVQHFTGGTASHGE